MPIFEERILPAADGYPLTARFFRPTGSARGSVLIVPGISIPQTYYEAIASWLSDNGYHVATFDYRGIALSRHGSLRHLAANLIDWARLDCAAVLDALAEGSGELPVFWLGHSLGGQILPFAPNRQRVSKMVTIATGSGYWRENSPPLRRSVWWLWYVIVPLAVRTFGYFPGSRLGKVGDLPRGVIEQWRRWCLHPDYAPGVEGGTVRDSYAAIRTPIFSLSFTDDEYMSAQNIASIHDFYVNAPRTMKRIAPHDIGEKRIGHFGFFKERFSQSLWKHYLLPELNTNQASELHPVGNLYKSTTEHDRA